MEKHSHKLRNLFSFISLIALSMLVLSCADDNKEDLTSQNGKCVACKIRDDLDPAVAFPAYDSKAEPHGIVFTYRKGTFRRVFLFIRTPIFFNQFDSNRQ